MNEVTQIVNYGRTRIVPTCQGNIRVPRTTHGPIEMSISRKAAAEIGATKFIEVTIPEAAAEAQQAPKIDYAAYHIKDLRSLAASLGIAGFFTMRKVDLIKNLEEQQ